MKQKPQDFSGLIFNFDIKAEFRVAAELKVVVIVIYIDVRDETKPLVLKKEQAITRLDVSNSSKTQRNHLIQQESIVLNEPTQNNSRINQNMIGALTSNYNNPININAAVIATTSIDSETAPEEKELNSYEVIDTEDPNRTIFIANFEIDGAAFRGITRRVSALLKRNKSEKEK